MEATPKTFDLKNFKLSLENIKTVKSIHGNLKINRSSYLEYKT